MKIHITTLAVALLLSNCTYHTYVVPKPTPPPTPVRKVVSKPVSHTSPDDFQAITKPSSYSR